MVSKPAAKCFHAANITGKSEAIFTSVILVWTKLISLKVRPNKLDIKVLYRYVYIHIRSLNLV